jgi:integrative and conjugative element protein (TIGR02256 family)
MKILLPQSLQQRLRDELARAKRREVGGLLMGEHLGADDYRIVDISVQRAGGSAACFIRHPNKHRVQLDEFFARTGANYTRFNYLGEWHSHPSFPTIPSVKDLRTMQSLVEDPVVGANFLALLIVRLGSNSLMEAGVTAFYAGQPPREAELAVESREIDSANPGQLPPTMDPPRSEHGDAIADASPTIPDFPNGGSGDNKC